MKAKELIDDKKLGRILSFRCEYSFLDCCYNKTSATPSLSDGVNVQKDFRNGFE